MRTFLCKGAICFCSPHMRIFYHSWQKNIRHVRYWVYLSWVIKHRKSSPFQLVTNTKWALQVSHCAAGLTFNTRSFHKFWCNIGTKKVSEKLIKTFFIWIFFSQGQKEHPSASGCSFVVVRLTFTLQVTLRKTRMAAKHQKQTWN